MVEERRWGAPDPGDDARLARWVADARVEEAARRRERERWLRQQADEGATLLGVLADLAASGAAVAVRTRSGRRHRGRIDSVGSDHVVIVPPPPSGADPGSTAAARTDGPAGPGVGPVPGVRAIVAVAALASVRTPPGVPAVTGDRSLGTGRPMAEVLRDLAGERERAVVVTLGGADVVAGAIRSVGDDVLVLRPDGAAAAVAYLPLGAVGEVILGA